MALPFSSISHYTVILPLKVAMIMFAVRVHSSRPSRLSGLMAAHLRYQPRCYYATMVSVSCSQPKWTVWGFQCSKVSLSDLEDPREKQLWQLMFSYMHVLESKMRGIDEQSSLFLARFWPSLQQSSMEICFPPVDMKNSTKWVFVKHSKSALNVLTLKV